MTNMYNLLFQNYLYCIIINYLDCGFLWFSEVPRGEFRDALSSATTASFHIILNLLFTNHPTD
jgi:hypothetical protein